MTSPKGFRILAVCSGNVCRSPFTELLLADRLARRSDFEVASAGTIARPGQRMTSEMIQVATHYGVAADVSAAHAASRLDEQAVGSADLILGLTREHRAAALRLFPAAVMRAFSLNEFARLAGSVASEAGERLTAGELVAEAASRRALEPPSAPDADDIDDPIGLSQLVYDRVGAEIAASIEAITLALLATNRSAHRAGNSRSTPEAPELSFSFREV